MKIKVIPYLFIAIIFVLIFNSCIILDQLQTTSDETTAAASEKQDTNNKVSEETGRDDAEEDVSDKEENNKTDGLSDQIIVTDPVPDQLITNPLIITGEARGTWFFEATFSVILLDSNGKVLALHYAITEEEWMTEDFIPFTANIELDEPETATGILILEKNNPSDIREQDAQLEIPVRFE
ncbi:MAG: Gmad2 immunoglobulin-like domain-containing protein [Actinomycetia bacterium]|nr:Gmad2 immunoglobulin-like domain-containing protein [Actinomycetes bacterium]